MFHLRWHTGSIPTRGATHQLDRKSWDFTDIQVDQNLVEGLMINLSLARFVMAHVLESSANNLSSSTIRATVCHK